MSKSTFGSSSTMKKSTSIQKRLFQHLALTATPSSFAEYNKTGQKRNTSHYAGVIAGLQGLINIKLKNCVFNEEKAYHRKVHAGEIRMTEVMKVGRKADHGRNCLGISKFQTQEGCLVYLWNSIPSYLNELDWFLFCFSCFVLFLY